MMHPSARLGRINIVSLAMNAGHTTASSFIAMGGFKLLSLAALASAALAAPLEERAKQPKSFFKEVGNSTWVIGNDVWNVTQNLQYATQLWYKGKDRVGQAVGHYVSYSKSSSQGFRSMDAKSEIDGAASDLKWTSASVVDQGSNYINVKFTAIEGDMHWVIYDGLHGSYQYFVNHALPTLGEFRTLWRLDNVSFPNARTNVRDGPLPALAEYAISTNVQDETWQKPDGTFLTKYDWSSNVRDNDFHGVYGDEVGSWYLNPGKDYFNGDHLKQELFVCKSSP